MADELDYHKMELQSRREARQVAELQRKYGEDEREIALDQKRYMLEKSDFSVDLLSTLVGMLQSDDEETRRRASLEVEVVKMFLEGGEASEKVVSGADKKLAKEGYNPDGQIGGPDSYSPKIRQWMTRLRATTAQEKHTLHELTTGDIFSEVDDKLEFSIGDPWSDMPVEHLIRRASGEKYGLFTDKGEPTDAGKIAVHMQSAGEIGKGPEARESLVEWIEGAQRTFSIRQAKVDKLIELKEMAESAKGGDKLAAAGLASAWMDENMPEAEPFFEDRAAVWEYYTKVMKELGSEAAEAGVTPKDLIDNPDRYSGALGAKRDFVDQLVVAQEKLKDDPTFRSWREDKGIKLAEGTKPSFALTKRYARAAARAGGRPRSSGRMAELTVRVDEEYDFGATGEGGAPVFALRADGSYVTPAELDLLHTKDLESAPVISAFVADPGSTKAFSAISAAVDPTQRAEFEASIQKILSDKTLSPRAQLLVDKNNSVVQIVNRDGKIMGSWKFPDNGDGPGNLQQMFNSFSTQPDIFSVAGSSAAFRKGRGGNQISELTHDIAGDEVYLKGGVGTYIPNEEAKDGTPGDPLRLTATPPTKKSVVVVDRPGAGQEDDTLYVNKGIGIKTSSIVGLKEVTPERIAQAKAEGGDPLEAKLFEGVEADGFQAGQRQRQLRRGGRRYRRAVDAPDWQEPVGVELQSALGSDEFTQELPRLEDIGSGEQDSAFGAALERITTGVADPQVDTQTEAADPPLVISEDILPESTVDPPEDISKNRAWLRNLSLPFKGIRGRRNGR